ncbi:hypothetical protein FALBO_4614 [Fusarium albosuccineum]|uniref:Uncharacterized protein n=1 Tax=Fusarium albosuccineum TaxID=1237068 RepID=A0A8H4PKQ1_9HYPO|nr:hypothetical protein FALBO_4614 [Fusarium albosuccineum]
MKSSNSTGDCSVCRHSHKRHVYETCAAKHCRNKIKVCGATLHYIPSAEVPNHRGWVVCKPCAVHGREGKDTDYSRYPTIGKDREGNIIILQEGLDSSGSDEDQSESNAETHWNQSQTKLETGLEALTINEEYQQGSSSSQTANADTGSVEVNVYYKKGCLRFMYLNKEVKTKPNSWFPYEAGGMTYYIFDSKDYGVRFYTFKWPSEASRGKQK